MTPQIARLYAHVLPIFWPYLWLQLRAIFKRQDVELRTLLIAVTKWGRIHIVSVGDHWRAYKKPAPVKAHWSDPIWESDLPTNLAQAPLAFSAGTSSAPCAAILPRLRGRCPAGTEGAAPLPDTS